MAYDKDQLIKLSIEAIGKHQLKNVTYIPAYLPCCTSTFYDLGLEKSEDIKKALFENKIKAKTKLKNNWENSDNPTLQIAAFKLMAEDEELQALTSSKFDHSSKDGTMTPKSTVITTLTKEQLKEALNK
jgi:hypothetical protein